MKGIAQTQNTKNQDCTEHSGIRLCTLHMLSTFLVNTQHFFSLSGLYSGHTEVPRPGVEKELLLPTHATATTRSKRRL